MVKDFFFFLIFFPKREYTQNASEIDRWQLSDLNWQLLG